MLIPGNLKLSVILGKPNCEKGKTDDGLKICVCYQSFVIKPDFGEYKCVVLQNFFLFQLTKEAKVLKCCQNTNICTKTYSEFRLLDYEFH